MTNQVNQIETIDGVVDALTMLLCGNVTAVTEDGPVEGRPVQGYRMQETNFERLYAFDEMVPVRTFTGDIADGERLYALDSSLLLAAPDEILGASAEAAMVCGETIKWFGFRQTRRLPKGLCPVAKCRTMYELHYRQITRDGYGTYNKSMVGVSPSGRPVPIIIPALGPSSRIGKQTTEALVTVASILEDSRRPSSVLAEFTDGATVAMSVGLEDYQELFIIRDGPLSPAGRRKAIIHWVARHRRKVSAGSTQVSRHLRGVSEFTVDGLTVRLTPSTT